MISIVMVVYLCGFENLCFYSTIYAIDKQVETKTEIPVEIQKEDGSPAIENDDYTVEGIVVIFNKSGNYKIVGNGVEVTDKLSFKVENNFEGEITLKDVKINLNGRKTAFKVESDAKLTLWIEGNNSLRTGDYSAAIEFMNATSGHLIIDSKDDSSYLWVQGWNGAAIGGAAQAPGESDDIPRNVSNIEIRGGNIKATSMMRDSTAIGVVGNISIFSQAQPTLSNFVISGGTITTDCNKTEGVGIGAGEGGRVESLKITGGNITVQGYGSSAAIGTGSTASIGTIEITGGTVNAVANGNGAAIGSGTNGKVDNIIISGGNIQATSKGTSAAIGVGQKINNNYPVTLGVMNITGGTIEAITNTAGYSIGADKDEQIQQLQIDGSSLKVSSIPTISQNSEGKEIALLTLPNMENVEEITINNHNMNVYGNHNGDNNFYFYLPKEAQQVRIKKQDQSEIIKNYTWDGSAFVEQEESKKQNSWDQEPSVEDWIYGEQIKQPQGSSKYGDIIYTYSDKKEGPYGVLPNDVHAGTWYMKAEVKETSDYTGLEIIKEFTIAKANSSVVITTANMDKVYDGKAVNEPEVSKTGSTENVTFTWYKNNGNSWDKLETAPINAGSYKVVATLEGNNNYNGATTEKEFKIIKATPSYTLPNDLVIKQGQELSSIVLPTGFTWMDSTQKAENFGMQVFKAIFTPTDTTNYQSVEVEISVNVIPVISSLNQAPTIHAENKTLTVGEYFDVMAGVSATDTEDGDLSSLVEVIRNTVDTSKAGVYEVTYKVTDKDKASFTKTITVTVKANENQGNPTSPTNPDKNDTINSNSNQNKIDTVVNTGDESNVLQWSIIIIISLAGVVSLLFFKRKRG